MSQHGTGPAGRGQAWRCRLLMAALVGLSGCMSGPGGPDYDPLRGGRPLPADAGTAQARAAVDSGDLPSLPSSSGASTPAALASSTSPHADQQPPTDPGVKVLAPRPVASTAQPITAAAATTVPASAPGAVGESTYEQLQQQLQARGVVWQQLKTSVEKGEWFFACAIPDPNSPGVQRHYEARAVGPFGLAAIRAVLSDIAADVKRRGEQ